MLNTEHTRLSRQSTTHRVLAGLFWTFSGTGLQAILQLLVLAVLARLLTPTDFGLVSAANVVTGFMMLFSQLGIGPAIVQRPQIEPRHLRTGFTVSVVFGVFLAGLIWLAAPLIAGFFQTEGLVPVLEVMSTLFLLQSVAVVAESLLQRELRFRWLAALRVLSYVLGYGVVGIGLALAGWGVWALVAASLAQALVYTATLLLVRPYPKRPQFERRAFQELIYFGGGFTAARVSNYLANQGDNLVVGRTLGPTDLGFYSRAYQMIAMPAVLFGQVLDQVLFPAMAGVQDRPEQLVTAYRRGVALIGLLALPASAAMLVLAPEIVQVLLGPGWTEVIVPFQILVAGLLFRTSYKMSDSLTRATGAVYHRAWRQAIYAALVIGGAWVGQYWGITGVAVGVLGAITVNFILMAQLSLRLLGMTWWAFVVAHAPAAWLAAIVGAEVWAVTALLRMWNPWAIVVLVVSALVVLLTVLPLVWLRPRLFLGRDGLWMLRILAGYIPVRPRVFRLLRQTIMGRSA